MCNGLLISEFAFYVEMAPSYQNIWALFNLNSCRNHYILLLVSCYAADIILGRCIYCKRYIIWVTFLEWTYLILLDLLTFLVLGRLWIGMVLMHLVARLHRQGQRNLYPHQVSEPLLSYLESVFTVVTVSLRRPYARKFAFPLCMENSKNNSVVGVFVSLLSIIWRISLFDFSENLDFP